MPNRSRSGEVKKPRARRRADERERLQRQLDRARARALADHDVELIVLERGIQHLLDDGAQAVNLVDEQHVVLFETRELRREIAGPLEHGAGRLVQIDAELVRDDVRERRLAETRRAEQQRVIERLARAGARP